MEELKQYKPEALLLAKQNKQIAAAFVKAQKNFAPALKASVNPHFKSKYVDLAGCVEAVIDALNDNGIALIQHTHESDTGVIVETMFVHESGETMSCGKLHVPASKHDAQGYGSALTYARRYSLMAACGIAPEDDDGNAASKGKPKATTTTPNDGAIENATDKEMRDAQHAASFIIECVADENWEGAYAQYEYMFKTHSAEHGPAATLAMWEILKPHSKIRNTLKKMKAERELQAAA